MSIWRPGVALLSTLSGLLYGLEDGSGGRVFKEHDFGTCSGGSCSVVSRGPRLLELIKAFSGQTLRNFNSEALFRFDLIGWQSE